MTILKGLGETPAILGRQIEVNYFGDDHSYFEIDINVGSSKVATHMMDLVLRDAKTVTLDLAFLIEGKHERELPEVLLGSVRMIKPDAVQAVPL